MAITSLTAEDEMRRRGLPTSTPVLDSRARGLARGVASSARKIGPVLMPTLRAVAPGAAGVLDVRSAVQSALTPAPATRTASTMTDPVGWMNTHDARGKPIADRRGVAGYGGDSDVPTGYQFDAPVAASAAARGVSAPADRAGIAPAARGVFQGGQPFKRTSSDGQRQYTALAPGDTNPAGRGAFSYIGRDGQRVSGVEAPVQRMTNQISTDQLQRIARIGQPTGPSKAALSFLARHGASPTTSQMMSDERFSPSEKSATLLAASENTAISGAARRGAARVAGALQAPVERERDRQLALDVAKENARTAEERGGYEAAKDAAKTLAITIGQRDALKYQQKASEAAWRDRLKAAGYDDKKLKGTADVIQAATKVLQELASDPNTSDEDLSVLRGQLRAMTENAVGATAPSVAKSASGPTDAAIKYLRDNPSQALAFDEKYGEGASAKYLNNRG